MGGAPSYIDGIHKEFKGNKVPVFTTLHFSLLTQKMTLFKFIPTAEKTPV